MTIVIVGTGGTIASTTRPERNVALPELTPNDVLGVLKGHHAADDVIVEDMFHLGSHALDASHIDGVVAQLQRHFEDGVEGAVITQGTASLPETAYLYDLRLGDCPPVVVTGAMRTHSDLSPDGPVNLRDSLLFVRESADARRGAYVVANGEVHAPIDVQKVNGASPAGFASPGVGVLGWVDAENVRMRRERRERARSFPGIDTAVDLVYVSVAARPTVIECLAAEEQGHGLVLGGFPGRGAVPPSWMPSVRAYLQTGRPVVFTVTSQMGIAYPKHGPDGTARDLANAGVIMGGDLGPRKARCLLMAALSETTAKADLTRIFETELSCQ